MRTRRSPRNQERLWRALGGPPAPKPAPAEDPVEVLRARLALSFLSPRTRRMLERDLEREIQKAKVRACHR